MGVSTILRIPDTLLTPQEHLAGVLRASYASNANGMHEMVDALTDEEKGTLRNVLTVG